MEDTKPLMIKLGDGYKAVVCGKCQGTKLHLEEVKITVDAFLFELEGIDMVLGISWLATLGEMLVDWGNQTMKCLLNGQWVELKGECNNRFTEIALQSFLEKPKRMVEGLFMSTEMNLANMSEKKTDHRCRFQTVARIRGFVEQIC